ncbi:MAG TPA: tetratricopeptide repeat protein [Candidatus Limnocylindria bacterium]|nr:tetratricopeptide repeat protein [Candidatus Limnocylindria bacterium]
MIERLLAGEAALDRDELDAAERLFSQIATADPRNAIALVGLARIAVRQGDRHGARALAVRALSIDPDEAAATRLLAELDRTAAVVAQPAGASDLAAAPQPAPTPNPATARNTAQVPAPSPRPAKAGWRALLDRLLRRG